MLVKKISTLLMSCILVLALAACDSAEERAEKHFQAGMTLLEEGDVERALVEFRNVFELNGRHKDARLTYARVVRDQGKLQEAFSQYLRFAEFYPDEIEGRVALIDMALETQNWGALETQLKAAQEIDADNPIVKVAANAQSYREALEENDRAAQRKAIAQAEILKQQSPDQVSPRRILLDGLLRNGQDREGLVELDAAIAIQPTDPNLHQIRLTILNRLGETQELERQFFRMIELFPENISIRQTLLRWYMSRDEADKAEAFLRSEAEQKGPAGKADLVRFLAQVKGPDAALAELDTIIEQGEGTDFYRSLRAGLRFENGAKAEAIAELEDILKTAEPSEHTRTIEVALARIRWGEGNLVGARELIENVLSEDETQVEALKLKASWLIEGDQTDEAIILLRTALDQSPQDAQIMTLMAGAYERSGNRNLVGEMLSLAVDASNSAPTESLRYARFLIADEKLLPAESILLDALRLAPKNIQILGTLGNVYLQMKDWARATQVEQTLAKIDQPDAQAMAKNLKLSLLQGQDHGDEVMRFLEGLVEGGKEDDLQVRLAIIRAHIAAKRPQEALAATQEALDLHPDSRVFRALNARLLETQGEATKAIAIYRELLAENDQQEPVWRELYAALRRDGQQEAAEDILAQGMETLPSAPTLKWIKASLLEQAGDQQGAIEIYQQLYALDSNNLIVANNLASLLATTTDTPESLEKAYAIARRLRGAKQPHFQDTYGWIAYRRGDYQEALSHLEPAAASGLKDPSVFYHLGAVYVALNRPDDAKTQFERALDIAENGDKRPELELARQALKELEKPATTDQ